MQYTVITVVIIANDFKSQENLGINPFLLYKYAYQLNSKMLLVIIITPLWYSYLPVIMRNN